MKNENRIKVVWICHFTNKEVQDKLKPLKRIGEFAPWITLLIKLFENQSGIELHIVSPHSFIRGNKNFKLRGVYYHFFNAHIPFLGMPWPGILPVDYWSSFISTKLKVARIINLIRPDIIHLHGAENAYYSSSIIQFKNKYPVLITIQGFISHVSEIKNTQVKKRIECEQRILTLFNHFGVRTKTMGKDILTINPKTKLHWHLYPINKTELIDESIIYDIVFFAKVSKEKGIEDLLRVISILKKGKNDVSLLVIGSTAEQYKAKLLELSTLLNIDENVTWVGFLPTQYDVHKLASRASVSVLPTYFEIIAGTIIESMFLKIPVVSYDVGSIHEINDTGDYISLCRKGDIKDLSDKIDNLLKDKKLRKEKAEKAYHRAVEMFNNDSIVPDLNNAYKTIINDFKE